MLNTDSPKNLLKFITLPQGVMLLSLAVIFFQTGQPLTGGLLAVFICHVIFSVAVSVYYVRVKNLKGIPLKALYVLFASNLIIFPPGVLIMFYRLSAISLISPETLYLLGNSVSLIYLSAAIIIRNTSQDKNSITYFITACLLLPVIIFLLLRGSFSLGDFTLVLAVGLLCVFLFLLGKLGFIWYRKFISSEGAEDARTGYFNNHRMFIAVTAILLPQVGLFVNGYFLQGGGLLGDFSSPWFHIIAALNGLVLLFGSEKYRLPLFYLKSSGFAFIAYFTLIFIPYMPYAVIGIMVFGLGLLVYVPVAVFVLQLKQLLKDYKLLKNSHRKSVIMATALAGFLTIPALLALNFGIDRINFNKALAYTESAGSRHNTQQQVDFYRIKRSLKEIDTTMRSLESRDSFVFMPGTPLLSAAYRYIALDNMFFTQDGLMKLQSIFTPQDVVTLSETMWSEPEPRRDFKTELRVSERSYDAHTGAYTAWIDFEITQLNGNWLEEYQTKFTIPDGCFITDYYLYVEGEKKRGIITDKRAAQAAYESIIRTPRDPGIIYYENDNTISLRVYPFNGNETRKTGFQIMYSQNEVLLLEGEAVNLVADNPIKEPIIMDGVQFIPQAYKKNLPVLDRKPLYYFLLDAGAGNVAGESSSYSSNLERAKEYSRDKGIDSRYYAVSYQTAEVRDINSPKAVVQEKGGFNTAYAMGEIFSSVPEGYFPVIVMVTENINRVVAFEKNRLASPFPETDCYYRLNDDFSLTPYSLHNSEAEHDVREINFTKALNYNQTAVSGEKSQTLITDSDFASPTGNGYMDAFILQKNTSLADSEEIQIAFVKEAMKQRLLTASTSFIVMETKEQEDMLLSLQEQFLKGKSSETPSVMMNEPGWAVVFLVMLLTLFVKHVFFFKKIL